jgi:predicted component of viral defense system (DUF524 family)
MTELVKVAQCGPYELVAPEGDDLLELEDGALDLVAEHRYLVRLGPGSSQHVLRGALTIPHGGSEGALQFGNFIGIAELGGRMLRIHSDRLNVSAVDDMLEAVAERLASLPFAAETPTAALYSRDRTLGSDALYHAYAFLRDSMHARGPHDLAGAVERILARPHETLRSEAPQLTPIARVDRIDASTLVSIQSEPQLLVPVAEHSPLFTHPLARRLNGRMPARVRVRPLAHTTDTRENRFVVAALEAMSDVARQFERYARTSGRPSSVINGREAAGLAYRLQRWRRHRALADLSPGRQGPPQSTVLHGRAGYRELLRCYVDLLARTRLAEPNDMAALLEMRDAALIYEYWCYFQVVNAVERAVGVPAVIERFGLTTLGTHVPYGYRARFDAAEVLYNDTFSACTSAPAQQGRHSYSVRLRPDITLRAPKGQLHLFDAKLKRALSAAFAAEDVEDPNQPVDTFKREDLYKMHAYRDALGAASVWILYPGSHPIPHRYQVPWPDVATQGVAAFRGVGAVALRPGTAHDGGLQDLVCELLHS